MPIPADCAVRARFQASPLRKHEYLSEMSTEFLNRAGFDTESP